MPLEPWIERRPNGRRHRPIAVVVRRTVRGFEREVTEDPANKKPKPAKVSVTYPEPGSNRHDHFWSQDFKSGVSTDSTIRAGT